MTATTRNYLLAAGLVFLTLLGIAMWRLGLVAQEVGYFSPVYSGDGNEAYYITRESRAIVLGLGWEFFTPPAYAIILRDRFALYRMPASGGRPDLVQSWPPSPLEGKTIRTYRGRIFSAVQTHVRWGGTGKLEFEIAVTEHKQPLAETWTVRRVWDKEGRPSGHDAWRKSHFRMGGYEEDAVRGEWELLAVPGREAMPCALAAHNAATSEFRVLVKTGACDSRYPDGINWALVAPASRRSEVSRIRLIRDTHQRLVHEGLAKGMGEGAALLAAAREMERLGFYPKTPKLVARPFAAGSSPPQPLFEISEEEFRAGLFQDIEEALRSPSEEVDKSMGSYVRMDGYGTSARINEFLAGKNSLFYIKRGSRIYELKLLRETSP